MNQKCWELQWLNWNMLWQDESNLVPYQPLMLWGLLFFFFFQVAAIYAVSICALIERFVYAETCQDTIGGNHPMLCYSSQGQDKM